eukprot:TRINITY_DN41065_c0_g2_i1.p1 TRINITY_DN41065_c0_g2~~TRINITY_DN41065_c0_g2_i1.p1  ORF type:complete len:710 (-),score=121.01 TRINITY_DN41065_c0_g2_i1:26-1981(-)
MPIQAESSSDGSGKEDNESPTGSMSEEDSAVNENCRKVSCSTTTLSDQSIAPVSVWQRRSAAVDPEKNNSILPQAWPTARCSLQQGAAVWSSKKGKDPNPQSPSWKRGQSNAGLASCVQGINGDVSLEYSDAFNPILMRITHSRPFVLFCQAIILANCYLLGSQANCSLVSQFRYSVEDDNTFCHWELRTAIKICWFFFLLELLCRAAAEGRDFVVGHSRWWNILDIALVLSGFLHIILESSRPGRTTELWMPNLTSFRLFRAIFMVQWLQVPWLMRFFRKLRLMMFSIIRMFGSLTWALLLMLIIIFLFGVVFADGIVRLLCHQRATVQTHLDPALEKRLGEHFGSLAEVVLSLFMAVSGGTDWYELMSPLSDLSQFYGWLFVFYIAFVLVGVMNVVTGVFVDSATQISQFDRDVRVQEQLAEEEKYMTQLRKVFEEADEDKSGTLNWKEFEQHLRDDRIAAYLSTLELDITEARGLYKLLDIDERDEVAIEDFISGCMRLRGHAKSIDLCTLLYENRKQARRWADFTTFVEKHFDIIEEALVQEASTKRPQTWRTIQQQRQTLSRKRTAERDATLAVMASKAVARSTSQMSLSHKSQDSGSTPASRARRSSVVALTGARFLGMQIIGRQTNPSKLAVSPCDHRQLDQEA